MTVLVQHHSNGCESYHLMAASCNGNHESLALLVSMGFDQELSAAALVVSAGNVESAINYLTDEAAEAVLRAEASRLSSAGGGNGSMDLSLGTTKPVVLATSSQYSFDGGQSACTCMALEIAQELVMSDNPSAALSSTLLDRSLRRGVEIYTSILTSSTEHMSAEEAWTQFSNLKLEGEIVQGVLSHDRSHPQGLMSLLSGRCSTVSRVEQLGKGWLFVVLTKTPETVLLCLSQQDGFWLVDSHPRPNIWPDAIYAYAKHHASLEELVASVNLIFPIVDLGSDVPELMTVMYNSFDLYTFVKKPT
jgi:UBA/TS-N domain